MTGCHCYVPSKHETFNQCWVDVGPASYGTTSTQHWFNVSCLLGRMLQCADGLTSQFPQSIFQCIVISLWLASLKRYPAKRSLIVCHICVKTRLVNDGCFSGTVWNALFQCVVGDRTLRMGVASGSSSALEARNIKTFYIPCSKVKSQFCLFLCIDCEVFLLFRTAINVM